MLKPPIPKNEEERIEALEEYQVLDTPQEAHFDEVAKTAAIFCDCEFSYISFIHHKRQWLKSTVGMTASNVERNISFCSHLIADDEGMIVVEDTKKDKRFFDNPSVLEAPYLRFYAGLPLITPDGHKIGTLCVADSKAKSLNEDQELLLKTLSKQVMSYLELNKINVNIERKLNETELYKKALDTNAFVLRFDSEKKITFANDKFCKASGYDKNDLIGSSYELIISSYHDRQFQDDLWQKISLGQAWRGEIRAVSKGGEHLWLDSSVVPFEETKKTAQEFMFIAYDVTEKKESEFLYNETQKIAKMGGWELNVKTNKVTWTEETFRIHELEASEEIGTDEAISYYAKHDRPRIRKYVEDCILKGIAYSDVFELVTAKGNIKQVHSRAVPELDSKGQVLKVLGTFQDVTELKAKENELRVQTQKLEQCQSISKLGFWEFDIQKESITWSNEMFKIFPERIQDGVPDLEKHKSTIHPDDLENWELSVSKCLNEGTPYKILFRTHKLDNPHEVVWLEATGEPRLGGNGEVISLFGTCQDVSERENYKREILRQKSIMNSLLDDMPHVVWYKNLKHRIVFTNQKYADFFNVSKEKLVGKTDLELFPGDKGQSFYQKEREVLKKQTVDTTEAVLEVNGRRRSYRGTQFPIYDHEGQCIGTGGIVEDVTESRKVERDLRLILENNKIGLWQFDPIKNELHWDQSMYEVFDVDQDSFSGAFEAWEKTLHDSCKETAPKAFKKALESDDVFEAMFKITTRTGEVKDIGARAIIERDEKGQAVFVTGVNWDRTREQSAIDEMNKQAAIAQHNAKLASIGELSAGVGHEINNPLAVIKTVNTLLLDYQNKSSASMPKMKLERYLKKVDLAVERIADIVNGLRSFSRAESLEKKSFSPLVSIEESYKMVRDIYTHQGVELTLDFVNLCSEDLIKGSRGKFQQIFMNLISNAKDSYKGTSSKRVQVILAHEGGHIVLKVVDQGEGVPKENLDKIFNPFFTTKDVNQGTGIGLSVVYNYVKEMDGEIEIKSEVNLGTECVVRIPYEIERLPQASKTQKPLDPYDLSHYKASLILVDDEEVFREMFCEVLEGMGFQVTPAEDGQEAYDLYIKSPESYDLIISDVRMPVLDGPSLVKKVRSHRDQYQPGIIIITGGVNLNLGQNEEEITPLVDGYLYKPFNKDKMFNALKKYFEDRQLKVA